MKIVIPGGSGQVGTVLARSFHRDGHQVVVLSREPRENPWRMVVWDGKRKVLGTSPMGFACPRAGKPPLVWDQASSVMAQGDVLLAAGHPAAGHVLPDEQAELVAVVVEPGRLDLDVLAEHVEAELLEHFEVVLHRRVRRRGE